MSKEMPTQRRSYRQICTAFDRGQMAYTVELCKKHLQQFPDDFAAWIWKGMAHTELHQYAKAEQSIRRGIALFPKKRLEVAYVQMGSLFEAKNDFKNAALWYRRASHHDPKNATYHIYLGSISFRQGRLNAAESHYRRALKCSDGSIEEAQFNLGGIMLTKGRYKEAIDCYQRAIVIDPNYNIAKRQLADATLALRTMTP